MNNKSSLAKTVALWPRGGNYVGFLDGWSEFQTKKNLCDANETFRNTALHDF